MRGAREHNLKNISVELPRDKLIVFTGLSGSGKSQPRLRHHLRRGPAPLRRVAQSSYARQFLGQMDKPDVDVIEGLSPAISIDQKSASRNPRSTVGTITEVYDYLRLLYARIGVQHCPNDGTRAAAPDARSRSSTASCCCPRAPASRCSRRSCGAARASTRRCSRTSPAQGFVRARIDGEVVDIDEFLKRDERLARYEQHTIEVVVDRLVHARGHRAPPHRLARDGAQAGRGRRRGRDRRPRGRATDERDADVQPAPRRARRAARSYEELAPRNFSFNSPYGACATCDGLGTTFEVDPELVIPDPDLSHQRRRHRPVAQRRTRSTSRGCSTRSPRRTSIDLDAPWATLTAKQQKVILARRQGQPHGQVQEPLRPHSASTPPTYEGVIPWIKRRHEGAESDWSREQYEGYMREVPCHGVRRRPAQAGVAGRHDQRQATSPRSATCRSASRRKFLAALELTERDRMIAERVTKEINARLGFLLDVGLDYLTLSRSAGTLAGGEAQRIRLASQIGSGLVGTLYVLDEPSIGLHQRDNRRLIDTLIRLRDLGNTVHRRRARRGDDPRERLDRRHRARCRRARRRGRLQRPGQGDPQGQGLDHRAVPLRAASRSRCRSSAGRHRRAVARRSRAPASTTSRDIDVDDPARLLRRRSPACRGSRQVARWCATSCCRC